MAKSKADHPDTLRPYIVHGVDLQYRDGDKEALAECPWCNKPGKFSVNIQSGLWRCWACSEGNDNDKGGGGNATVFIRMLWERSYDLTPVASYSTLAVDRNVFHPSTLVEWNFAKSILTGNWMVPGYSVDGRLTGLYQYVWNGTRMMLLPTPTMGHHLFGMNLYDAVGHTIFLCEGIWDSVVLYEALAMAKPFEDRLVRTSSREVSLINEANVLGSPSANTFKEEWVPVFAGKTVNLMTQNDHERFNEKTQKTIKSASYEWAHRITQILASASEPPLEINLLHWADVGFDVTRKSGRDTRDVICEGKW